jgi:hypothetical protein
MDNYDSYNTAKSEYKTQKHNYGSYYSSNYRSQSLVQDASAENIKVNFLNSVDRIR